ncbi:hypothetical protein [Bacillus sp. FJAT-45066]|uniref:hypothetical protein n=1 Tax=Bacillus sp. FJAT-45066 TaxID=2011010 RepID=UPI000BB72E84|nr:hypothetical protein [Bacillus sp. FJAT-45066]
MLDNIEVQKILLGEKQLFSKVAEAFEQDLYVFVKTFHINEETAITLVKDSFIYTYNQLHNYKESEIFSEWFATTKFAYLFKVLEQNIKMEEAPLLNASYKETFIFLLHELLHVGKSTISKALNISNQDVELALTNANKYFYVDELTEGLLADGCLSSEELLQYVEKINDEKIKSKVEDHLEFCPSCRESIFSMKSLKKVKLKAWRNQHLDVEIAETIMEELIPYKKKKQSWRYQYLAALSVVALFSIFMFVVPNVVTWVSAASNYVKYGQFYNVWGSGTYAVEDSNVKFEVLHVEVSPLFLYVHYDVDKETKDRFYRNENNYYVNLVQPWGDSVFRMKTEDDIRYDLAISNIPMLNDGENVLIFSLDSIEKIPDEFELEITIREIAHRRGLWDLTIPIKFSPFKDNIEIVNMDVKETFANSIEFSIEQFLKTSLGNIIEYKVSLTDEEVDRITASTSEESKQQYGFDSNYLKYNVYPMVSIQSSNDLHLIPIDIIEYNRNWVYGQPQKSAFSDYYYDMEELRALYENGEHNRRESIVKGRLDTDETTYMVLQGFQYHIPVDISIPIKLEEVEDYPLNIEVNGDVFETITIKKITVDKEEYNPERFDIVMKGSKQSKYVKNIYHWNIMEVEIRDGWQQYVNYTYGENNHSYESETVGFHLQVFIDENTPEEVEIKSTGMQRIIHLEEPLKISLGKKE